MSVNACIPSNASSAGRLPPWMKRPYRASPVRDEVRGLLAALHLATVCEKARCPNLCECWSRGTATFLILGDTCTRSCRFCAVRHGAPLPAVADEPERLARAAESLRLKFVVVTSVTRDDLPDGGAAQFAAVIRAVRHRVPDTGIEVLTPDFQGEEQALRTVLDAGPDVFNHNIETCRRLTAAVRSGADYGRSLNLLATAARIGGGRVLIKSGIMLGLGEEESEIREMLTDLRDHGAALLTIGQYLPPSRGHWPLARYVSPDEFAAWRDVALREYRFRQVVSGPLVRSSYLAERAYGAAGRKDGE